MKQATLFLVLSFLIVSCLGVLPTNYEYYTSNGIASGLSDAQPYFTLNGKNISIYSGALHYFRIPRTYWPNRLAKLRAAGLNAVETYIPWNLHEPKSGQFDFGQGGSDMEDFLHLATFIELAKKADLFVIIRSGPFICAEFEFGGHPSWLLRETNIKLRTSDPVYIKYVTRWFNMLMAILAPLQFINGGPIIMFQVENEFALMGENSDKQLLKDLRNIMLNKGIKELLVTADNPPRGTIGTVPDLFLMTGNFNTDPETQLLDMEKNQPNRPVMVMEFWSGNFYYWGKDVNTNYIINSTTFEDVYSRILAFPASVNIYMFQGGTNYGFLNGASNLAYDDENTEFVPIVSTYDYDAPLTEAGDYNEKYNIIRNLMMKYNTKVILPDVPSTVHRKAYGNITIQQTLSLEQILPTLDSVYSANVVAMEMLDINDGSGQSYGYTVYRKNNLDLGAGSVLEIEGRVCDTVIVLINGKRVSPVIKKSADLDNFGTWRIKDSTLTLTMTYLTNITLDLVVENWGRVNVGVYKQFKGLYQGDVLINGNKITDWMIYPLEFKKSWTNALSNWETITVNPSEHGTEPRLYRTTLELADTPTRDSYVYMEHWTKGIVVVNGFVLGRYSKMGPEQALFLPAPFLKQGSNDIIIFEHYVPSTEVKFTTDQVYKNY